MFKVAQVCPLQNDVVAKAMRFLGRTYRILVERIPEKIDLSELKMRVISGLENYRANADVDKSWTFAALPLSVSRSAIMDAENAKELYSILALPSPLECRDQL